MAVCVLARLMLQADSRSLLLQCLTMDCCGAGRLFEAMFDFVAFCWWLGGAITLTVRCACMASYDYELQGQLSSMC
jgi:hypothetical protein